MNIPDTLLGEVWYWAGWLIWLICLFLSLKTANWSRLKDSELHNVWLGMIVLLVLVWSMKAGVKPGLDLHLLGGTLATLCFGPGLAFIGLSFVALGVVLNGGIDPFAFGLNALLLAGGTVALSQVFTYLVQRHLPPHFFVFIFVNGFFGAAVSVLGIGVLATMLLALSSTYELDYLMGEYLPYFILLAFSEAWLSGMMVTLFVVYRPKWIVSFDDSRYLVGK